MTDLEKKLMAALAPFVDMACDMDDAEDLIDDKDQRESVNIGFGPMTLGDWDRDHFRRAQQAFEECRIAATAEKVAP